jgi:hypothetical protein
MRPIIINRQHTATVNVIRKCYCDVQLTTLTANDRHTDLRHNPKVQANIQYVPSNYCYQTHITHKFNSFVLAAIVEPGYNDTGLCDTSSITLDILWYRLISHR